MPIVDTTKVPSMERSLANYRLRFINRDFPLLSFIYAVMSGGEHTIYCDYTADYVNAYFEGVKDKPYIQEFFKLLGEFEKMTDGGPPAAKRTKIVHALPADWDQILNLLKQEMSAVRGPEPKW